MAKKMPNMNRLISTPKGNLKSTREAIQEKERIDTLSEYKIEYIPVSQLEPMKYNREVFDVSDFDFIGETIKEFGLLQPLVVQKQANTDKYLIIAGERRYQSYLQNIKEDKSTNIYAKGLPCRVFPPDMPLVKIKMLVIIANATGRVNTVENQISVLKHLMVLFEEAEENGVPFPYTLKDLAMAELKISERQFYKYKSSLEVIDGLKDVAMKSELNLASAIGSKPVEVQEEILGRYNEVGDLKQAYDSVNEQYVQYKQENIAQQKEILRLKTQIKDMASKLETADDENQDQLISTELHKAKKELKEKKKQLEGRKQNIKDAFSIPVLKDGQKDLKAVETSASVNKKDKSMIHSIPAESVDVSKIDPHTIPVEKSLEYLDSCTRNLFIRFKEVDTYSLEKMKEIRHLLDQAISRVENGGIITSNCGDSDAIDKFTV